MTSPSPVLAPIPVPEPVEGEFIEGEGNNYESLTKKP
jgi:hypothetical protein